MRARAIFQGKTMKSAVVEDIPAGTDDSKVLDIALVAMRETRSSIFGWTVTPSESNRRQPTAVVVVHTD